MNLLAIDTCTEVCSVSLSAGGVKISRFVKDVDKKSGLILPLCDEVFAKVGIGVSELDGIIYTRGPGTFTGVRMCVAVAQGLSLASAIPTLGFSTLEVIGFGAAKKYNTQKIAVALDARMGEVYWGVYENAKLQSEVLKKPNAVTKLSADFIGVGTGWGVYQSELLKQTKVSKFKADFYPQAQNLIELYLRKNNTFNNKLPLPKYLRNNIVQKSLK